MGSLAAKREAPAYVAYLLQTERRQVAEVTMLAQLRTRLLVQNLNRENSIAKRN